MVEIAAGRVTLTDRRSTLSWTVDLAPYAIATVPTTQGQYARVTGLVPSTTSGDRLPAAETSWFDAVRYCNALSVREGLTAAYRLGPDDEDVEWDVAADGYRLPSEAEWEHACRAGTTGPRYGPLNEIAWYRGTSAGQSHEVGQLLPNAWGLHDTLGNVWEWCWDLYDPAVYGDYRVFRGGGWFDEHWSCRASVRRGSYPTCSLDDVGFRVARNASGPPASRTAPGTGTASHGHHVTADGAAQHRP